MRLSKFKASRTLLAVAACTSLLFVTGCGGGGDDSEDSFSSSSNPLSGTWYASSIMTSWTFDGTGSTGTGTLRTRSYDGGSCQITDISYSVNAGSDTVTYTITRAAMTGNSGYNYDSATSGFPAGTNRGPFTESYSVSGSSLKIGNGTYSPGSKAC